MKLLLKNHIKNKDNGTDHLNFKLDGASVEKVDAADTVIMGSDEEKAIVNAIRSTWPQSMWLHCTVHLRKNLDRHLTKYWQSMQWNGGARQDFIRRLFGSSGLLSMDLDTFNIELEELWREVQALPEVNRKYISTTLQEPRANVYMPANYLHLNNYR